SDWYPYNMAPVYMEIISEVTGVPYKMSRGALEALKKVQQGGIVPKRLDITRLPARVKPPVVDGDLSDGAWARAVHIPVFARSRTTAPLPGTEGKTEAWVTYDSNNLYVAYRCHEPEMGSLIVAGSAKPDSKVDRGDNVQLWLTPGAGVRPFYQIIINPENFVFDRREQKPEAFDGNWKRAALKREKDWQVELAFPWNDIGIKMPKAGTTLRANLNRVRRGRPEEVRRWRYGGYDSLDAVESSWSQYDRGFTEITNLGYWTFK
ncbi:MAG: carbohydrate-binding family 9-like protein, partial [Arenicellales bacterium]|nr:carbohydrate-binding family 9-like protein [Arenicellales bacterium]